MMRKNVWYNDKNFMGHPTKINPMMRLIASVILFTILASPTFAEEPRSALDSAPSVDLSAKTAAAMPAGLPTGASVKPTSSPDELDELQEPPAVKPEAQESYVYDLKKLIIKSRENIKRVNDKIKEQAIIKRNQKREERAREYYQRGLQLQDEGKLDEAREYFDKAVRITEHPEMNKYVQQSEIKLKAQEAALRREEREKLRQQESERNNIQQQAKDAYEQGVRFYREKKFKEAKEQFEHVEELSADYKASRSYLKIIDQDIIKSEALAQKEQSQEMDRQQKEAEAARQREKESWKQEIDRKEKERSAQVDKQAQDVYEEAVALYKGRKYVEAKKKFQEVEWVIPDYKATRNYLARADRDIALQEKEVAEQKAKVLAQQQWEEEVAKRKKEAQEKREAEEKAKVERKQLEDQAAFLYQAAVSLYDKKSYDEALEKFNDIEKTVPGFKSTRVYVAKINQIKQKAKEAEENAKQRQAQEEAKLKQRQLEEEMAGVYNAAIDLFNQRQYQESKNKFIDVNSKIPNYKRISYYLKKIDEQLAKAKEITPATAVAIVPAQEAPVVKPPTPEAVKENITKPSIEEEKQEAAEILALAEKASQMYKQITALSLDKRMAPAKRKIAQVDQILNNLRSQKEAIIRQIKEDEERQRQKELLEKREAARRMAQQSYDEAIMLLRNKQYDEAKAKFQELEDNAPNFRSTRQYLSHIDQDSAKAEREAVLERTQSEQKRFEELEAKRIAEEEAQRKAEEERKVKLREAQEREIEGLAEKASILNDEILNLSQMKKFKEAKAKFDDLEKTLEALQTVKHNIAEDEAKERERQEEVQRIIEEKQKAKEYQDKVKVGEKRLREEKERQERAKIAQAQEVIERAPKEAKRKEIMAEVDARKLRVQEIRQHQAAVFRQAVELYNNKKYAAAKVIFDDLAARNNRDAKSYVRKIDALLLKGELALKAQEQKERSKFIAEEIRKQRLVNIMQQKERARQEGLTRELERQKRLAEDARQQDRMRLETLRLQIKDRQRIEYEQRKAQRAKQKTEEEYRFRKLSPKALEKKVEVVAPPVPAIKEIPAPVEVKAIEVKEEKVEEVPSPVENQEKKELIAKERKEQIALSNKRKKYLMEKYRQEEAEKKKQEETKEDHQVSEEAAKAETERRNKLVEEEKERKAKEIEDRQKKLAEEKERREKKIAEEKERKAKEIEDRQKKLAEEKERREKKIAEEKERKAKEEEKRKEMERMRHEESIKAAQELEERRKAEFARKEELRKKQEELAKVREERQRLDKEARERQQKLEEERKAIRQKLMDGVKDMYLDAVRMYKAGDYTNAALKFQDIEDLVPDYKQTRDYIIKSRKESLQSIPVVNPITIPAALQERMPRPVAPVIEVPQAQINRTSVESSVMVVNSTARDQAIQKTLDVFDSDAH